MDKYLTFESVDFAQDPTFISWVRKSDPQSIEFWDKWLAEHPEKNEEIQNAIRLVNTLVIKNSPIDKGVEDKVWSKIRTDIGQDLESNKRTPLTRGRILSLISIATVAAAAIFFLMFNTGIDYDISVQTPVANTKRVVLPDGSKVIVNAESKLSYDSKNWEEERKLSLDGEAFFEVQKGSKFIVHTNHGDVQVLGTSFNVYTRDKDFNVICKTGKVSVTTEDNSTILMANESVVVTEGKHDVQKNLATISDRSTWRKGVYTYQGEALTQVIDELERQLDLTISIDPQNEQMLYTGSFYIGDVESALHEVFWPLGLNYNLDNGMVTITK